MQTLLCSVCFSRESMVALINYVSAKLKRGLYLNAISKVSIEKYRTKTHSHTHTHTHTLFFDFFFWKYVLTNLTHVSILYTSTHKTLYYQTKSILMLHLFINPMLLALRTEDSLTRSKNLSMSYPKWKRAEER